MYTFHTYNCYSKFSHLFGFVDRHPKHGDAFLELWQWLLVHDLHGDTVGEPLFRLLPAQLGRHLVYRTTVTIW